MEKIESQGFDSFGKTRVLFCKHNEKILQIFTSPLPPFSDNYNTFDKSVENLDDAINFFNEVGIKLYVKTKNAIVAKYNQIYFAIKVKDTSKSKLHNSIDFYKKFTILNN